MITVILVEPETAGNVGAIARAMANFGFSSLVLVNPGCDHLCDDARKRAKHAREILENAEIVDSFPSGYDYLVATTARLGTEYNMCRSPMSPEEFACRVSGIADSSIGLVIGRESTGLFNEELQKCDFTVTIPTSHKYSSLNVSHAVCVLLYELHKTLSGQDMFRRYTPASSVEKEQILSMFDEVLDHMSWDLEEKKETQIKLWRRIVGKAMLTKREAYAVMGFLRKLLSR